MRARQIARWNNFNWLAAQSAELDALRADKKRLDWLESRMFLSPTLNYLAKQPEKLREAIDAAIAAKEDKPNG
jgi:nicotinic acid phosphoribosyltransferase